MRTTTIIQTAATDDQIREALGGLLVSRGFVFTKYKKQELWKKGVGLLAAPQLFNIYKKEGKMHIESWIPFALFPGVYIGESGLKSGFGFAVKIGMRNILKEIIGTFILPGTSPEGYVPK